MKLILLPFLLVGLASAALAQVPPNATTIVAPAEPDAIMLYKGVAPGSENARQKEAWSRMWGRKMVRNITRPSLTPVFPKKGMANGAAVLVIPGGGFQFISMENEGWPIAQWLADRGVTAFILKYRLEETPVDEAAFEKAVMARIQPDPDNRETSPGMMDAIGKAQMDAQTAIRLIRQNAGKWNIDPERVGMLGFSAGAITTMVTTLADDPTARPDFIAPIYGMMDSVTPPANPQPMFAALAADDPLFSKQGFGLIESWQKAGGSVEFHYYQGGQHGFGSRKMGTTSDLWFDQFMAWMDATGLLKPKSQ